MARFVQMLNRLLQSCSSLGSNSMAVIYVKAIFQCLDMAFTMFITVPSDDLISFSLSRRDDAWF